MRPPFNHPTPPTRGPVAHLQLVSAPARGAMEGGALRADEAERALLGSVLLDGEALFEAQAEGVTEADFYKEAHRKVWRALEAMGRDGVGIDVVTVLARLLDVEGGEARQWAGVLSDLPSATPTAANVAHYARLVGEVAARRRLRAALADAGAALDEGVVGAVEAARDVARAAARVEAAGGDRGVTALAAAASQMAALEGDEVCERPRFASGLVPLDELLDGGLYAGQLVIVIGSSGGGKTTLLRHLALSAAGSGWPVSYYSAEEGPDATFAQMAGALGHYSPGLLERTHAGRLRAGEDPVRMEAVVGALGRLRRLPLRCFGARGRVEARQILAQMRAAPTGPEVFAVDYLQRLDLPSPARREDTRSDLLLATVRELADAAAQTGKLLLLAAQAPSGLVCAPQQSQISECPRAEQAAETIVSTWIPSRADKERDRREFVIEVLKQRYGPTGSVVVDFTGHCKSLRTWQGAPPRQPQPKPKGGRNP